MEDHFTPCNNYNKLDEKKFQEDVNSIDWSNILATENCETAAELFTTKFLAICDIHAPMRTITLKDHAPAWITNDYLAHRDERKYDCKNFNKNKTEENKVLKDEAIKRCNDLKASLQRSYFQEAITKHAGDMKAMWREIKKFWPHLNKSSVRPRRSPEMSDDQELANLFNDFFAMWG